MSEHGGPDRRRAPRHRAGKPYAKISKPAIPPKSSFSSLFGILTAPFRKTPQPSDDAAGETDEATDVSSDEESEERHDSSSEVDRQLPAIPSELTEREDASSSTSQTQKRRTLVEGPYSKIPPPPQLSRPALTGLRSSLAYEPTAGPSAKGSLYGGRSVTSNETSTPYLVSSRPFSPPSGVARDSDSPAQSAQEASARSTPMQTPSATSPQDNSPYKEIVDFLQTKKDDKLNHMEIIGLTQSLRKNATKPAQEVIDYIEAAANIPSAALLESFKPPPNVAASPNKPLLFPPSPPTTTNVSPARSRRRRSLYTGVGQSPRRAGGSITRELQPTPSRLRLHHTPNAPEESAPTNNKKRLVGDSATPIPSGSANGTTNTFASPPATSTVPFPLASPAKPQRAPPPTNAGPFARPTMAGSRSGLFGTVNRAPLARPEAPRQPSPLRKSNLDLSMSSGGSDADDSFEERRSGPRKSDPNQRTHASTTILDIVMDEANPLPPVKSRAAPELKNPFEDMVPTPPRVSTPVRRPTPRLSRPWTTSPSPAPNLAPPKHGIASNNILDQIDSTAPKPSPAKPILSAGNDLPGVVNPFASTSTLNGGAPSGPGQRIKSPPVTAFRSIASTTSIEKPKFGIPSAQPMAPTKVLSSSKATKTVKPSFGFGPNLDKIPSAPVTTNMALVEALRVQKPSKPSLTKSAPTPPLPAMPKKRPEIVVVDDSDSESDTSKITVAPAKPKAPKREEIIVEELDNEDEVDEDGADENMRSGSPSPSHSPTKPAQHPFLVEEVDENTNRSGIPLRSSGSRFGGTLSIPNGLHGPFKTTSPVVPSPLRKVSLPPSDEEDELSSTENEDEPRRTDAVDTTKVASTDGVDVSEGSERLRQQKLLVIEPGTPKTRALQLPLQALTTYEIISRDQLASTREDAAQGPTAAHMKAKTAVRSLPVSELPKFDLFAAIRSAPSSKGPSPPISATSGKSFDWAAAGMKPPAPSSAASSLGIPAEWVCDTCACKSPASADKCVVCEAPRAISGTSTPKPANAPTPIASSPLPSVNKGFDWAAAGLKPSPPASGTEWTCPVCAVRSPITAAKCIACEEPKPAGASKLSTPAVSPSPSTSSQGSFNWTAAGMKAPDPKASGKWSCGTCMIPNDATASQCAACETPRP